MSIWRTSKMDDFETITLSCGHVINQYNGLGVCYDCGKKTCGRCLVLVVDELLCPSCFSDRIRPVSQ